MSYKKFKKKKNNIYFTIYTISNLNKNIFNLFHFINKKIERKKFLYHKKIYIKNKYHIPFINELFNYKFKFLLFTIIMFFTCFYLSQKIIIFIYKTLFLKL